MTEKDPRELARGYRQLVRGRRKNPKNEMYAFLSIFYPELSERVKRNLVEDVEEDPSPGYYG